jgi:hypothetical protein
MNKLTKLDNFLLDNDNSNIIKNQVLTCSINNNITDTSFTALELCTILILTSYKISVSQNKINDFPQLMMTCIAPHHLLSLISLMTVLYCLPAKC